MALVVSVDSVRLPDPRRSSVSTALGFVLLEQAQEGLIQAGHKRDGISAYNMCSWTAVWCFCAGISTGIMDLGALIPGTPGSLIYVPRNGEKKKQSRISSYKGSSFRESRNFRVIEAC